ncbi:MAG: 50S ribosomal protein L1 [Endomicrobium sp.]|jgi:large subunit ribosomal protein L1|nr:50S ribosomal protein L1 [Endomicrobium sp.]
MKIGKRLKDIYKKYDKNKFFDLSQAIDLLKEVHKVKFDESVDIDVRLNVDPKKAEQNIRATVNLPNGNGKTKRILVIAKSEKLKEAEDLKVDFCGAEDMIEKINGGWFGFDVMIATPDMMKYLGKIGKVLGPRGLMPNPKAGTVTVDIKKAVNDIRNGKVEFRVDSYGIIHFCVGRISFEKEKLLENIKTFFDTLIKIKPSTVKGSFIKSLSITSTMGPGLKIALLNLINK